MESKTIRTNFIFNTIKTIMVVIFPVISFPYISRVLGVEGVGKVQYCMSVISYFILFASLGIVNYSVREGVKYRGERKKFSKFVKEIFAINLVTTVLAYLVFAAFFVMGAFQGKENIMLICSFSILGTTLSLDWLYQAMEEYVYISVRTILLQALALVLMFLLVKTEEDVLMYTLITILASKGYCFINLIHARKYVDFGEKVTLEITQHLKPILIIFGATLSVSIYMNMDVVMLGIFSGDYQVGLYSAAVKVNVVVKNVITSISAVLMPRLVSYLAKGDLKKYETLFRQGAELNMFFAVPSAVGLAILSEPIILLFSGEKFLPAVLAGQIMAVRLVFSALDNIFYNQVLIPNGHEKEACIGTAAGAVANLVLNVILIPEFQAEGAAVATVISEGVVFIYFVFAMRNLISLRKVLSGAYQFILAAAAMGTVIWIGKRFFTEAIWQLMVLVPVGAIVYIGIVAVLKRLNKSGAAEETVF